MWGYGRRRFTATIADVVAMASIKSAFRQANGLQAYSRRSPRRCARRAAAEFRRIPASRMPVKTYTWLEFRISFRRGAGYGR